MSERDELIKDVGNEAIGCLAYMISHLKEITPGDHDPNKMGTVVMMDIRNLQRNCETAIKAIRDYQRNDSVQAYYFNT